jgi:uncharacterized protein
MSRLGRRFERAADRVLTHRALATAAVLMLLAAAGLAAAGLTVDFSVSAFFGAHDAALDDLHAYHEQWGGDDAVLMVIAESDGILAEAPWTALGELTDALDAAPDVDRVVSATTTPLIRGALPGLIDLTPLGEAAADLEPQELRERLKDHPLFVPLLLSEDLQAAAIFVVLDVNADDIQQLRPAVEHIRSLVADHNGRGGLRLATAGVPAVRADFFEVILEDQLVTVPIIGLVMSLLLLMQFRRLHALWAAGLAALLPMGMVFGAMGLFGEPIGILNQSYFTLLPAIAVADAIHMIGRFHEQARRLAPPGAILTPNQRRQAIREAVGSVGTACLLTSTTTAIGFASLYLADMPILRSYGLYAGLGIVFAYGAVLVVVPLVLSFTRGSVPDVGREGALTRIDRLLLASADVSVKNSAAVIAITLAVLGGALWLGARVVVDNTLTGLLAPDHDTSIAGQRADARLGGILGLEVDLLAEPGRLRDPDVLVALAGFEAWALQQAPVRAVQGPATWATFLAEVTTGDPTLPNDARAIAQAFVLVEGEDALGQIVDVNTWGRARTTLRTQDEGGNAFEALCVSVRRELDERLAGLGVEARVTGTPYVAYRGINRITFDLRDSLGLAFVLVALVILLLFRSPRLAALCLLPNAAPLIIGYGLMGAMGWMLDTTPAVVFVLALGIAVDDTIHLLARTREEAALGRTVDDAIRTAVLHTGRSVTVTSVVLCAGFAVNRLSSFPSMVVLGSLGATVIAAAWACDLFVLPALLARWGGPALSATTDE